MNIINFEFGVETFLKVSDFLNNLDPGTIIVNWAIAKNLKVEKHIIITSNHKSVLSRYTTNIYLILPNFGIDWDLIKDIIIEPRNKIITIGYGEELEFTSVFKIEYSVIHSNKLLEILFCQNKNFFDLQYNQALLKEKFKVLNTRSRVDESEQIVDFIIKNPKKKFAIIADQKMALILDTALTARKVKFYNGVNRKFTNKERNFLKIARYLSNNESNDIIDIRAGDINAAEIKALRQKFQKSKYLQEMLEINLKAYKQITQEVFPLRDLELANFEVSLDDYFELFLNLLGSKDKYVNSNIMIVNINEIVNNYDFCIFTHITLEEYYQFEKQSLESICKQEMKAVLAYKTAVNIFCNKVIYISYNTNINNIICWFELIHELLSCVNFASNEHNEEITYSSPVITVDKENLPKEISVTAVEKLIKDPYLYYTNHVLKLSVPKLSEEEDLEKLFGVVLHEILVTMVYELKAEILQYINRFMSVTKDILIKHHLTSPIVYRLWIAKFEKIAHWFWQYESLTALARDKTLTEVESWMTVNLGQGVDVKLSAQIDRVDLMNDGSIHIIDYKSGNLPSNRDIATGLSPQMPLEALIIKKGYINGSMIEVQEGKLRLYYLHLTGLHSIGSVKEIEHDLKITEDGLIKLLSKFWIENPRFFFNNTDSYIGDYYRHFARFTGVLTI